MMVAVVVTVGPAVAMTRQSERGQLAALKYSWPIRVKFAWVDLSRSVCQCEL